MSVVKSLFGGAKPAAPAAAPVAPTPSDPNIAANTAASTAAAAQPGPGRAANIVAGMDQSLSNSEDQFSVRKKLLGY